MIWLVIYLLSALACAGINWAEYTERKDYYAQALKDKVIQLYIIPLCPIANSFVVIGTVMGYFFD